MHMCVFIAHGMGKRCVLGMCPENIEAKVSHFDPSAFLSLLAYFSE